MSDILHQLLKENISIEKKFIYSEKRLNDSMELLSEFEGKGELIKAEYKRVGEAFGRMWDEVRDALRENMRHVTYSNMTDIERDISDAPFERTGLNKYLRTLNSAKKDLLSEESKLAVEKIVPVVEEMIRQNGRLNALKDCIVAKRRDAVEREERQEKESAQKAQHADMIKTKDFLSDLTESNKPKIVEKLFKSNKADQARMLAYITSQNGEFPYNETGRGKDRPIFYKHELWPVLDKKQPFVYIGNGKETANIADEKELDRRALVSAQKLADMIVEQYVYRVTDKLAYILVNKDCLSEIKCTHMDLREAIVADLHVKFKDNSSFTLNTSVVWAANPVNDGYHIKIPSRFMNVTKPDGTKLKNPSEKSVQDELTM